MTKIFKFPTINFILYSIVLFLVSSGIFAQNNYLPFIQKKNITEDSTTYPQRNIIDNGTNYIEIEYTFQGANVSSKIVQNINYNFLHIDGFGKLANVGKPALPSHKDIIAIPDNAKTKIIILEVQSVEYSGYMIHPALKPARDTYGSSNPIFEINQQLYNTNKYYPERIVDITETQNLRNTALAITQICPVQFNPVSGKIKVYSKIRFRIEFTGNSKSFESIGINNSNHFTTLLKNSVLNNKFIPNGQIVESSNGPPKNYIIITHSAYNTAADSLAKWKRQMGYSVEVVSRSSWTAVQVKDSIHSRYTNWTPKPDYFVILGDHAGSYAVPAEIKYTNDTPPEPFGTDLYFACMNGTNDYVPEMAHGRISVSSPTQAMTVVQKIINYERNPTTNSSFYSNGLNCAQFQDDNTNGYADRRFTHTSEEIRDYVITKGKTVARVYWTNSNVTPTRYNNGAFSDGQLIPSVLLKSNNFNWNGGANDITSNINSGKFYVFHRDHGYVGGSGWSKPYYTTSSMNNLTNGDKLPIIFSINCHTGEFTLNECFAEKFLRLNNSGAAGVIAASYYSYSGLNDGFSIGMIDAIWSNPGLVPNFGNGGITNPTLNSHSDIFTMGDVLNQGLIRMIATWNGSNSANRYSSELFHYFGDPAMKIWTNAPVTITATVPATIISGSTTLSISNSSCPTALATAYYNGELIGKTTLSSGSGTITFSPVTSVGSTIIVTLSKHNYRPFTANVIVTSISTPINDNPCNAILLAVDTACNQLLSSNTNATASIGITAPGCGNYNGGDVWFKAIVPADSSITFKASIYSGSFTDGAMALYSGSCGNLTLIQCDDNSGTGNMPKIDISGQIPGDTIFARFWEYGGNQNGFFYICAYKPIHQGNLAANPLSLNFGNVNVSGSSTMSFTIINTGNYAATVSNISTPSGFSIQGNTSFTVQANNSQVVNVIFSPTSAITYSGNISITSNANNLTIPVQGVGIQQAIIGISPTILSFTTTVNTTQSQNITVSNTGNATLTIASITLPNGFTAIPSNFNISPGNSQVVIITFAPLAVQTYSGQAVINSNAASGTNAVSLSGTGTSVPLGNLTVNPSSLNFGTIPILSSSQLTFNLTNTGNASVNVTGITTPAGFSIIGSTSFQVGQGASHQVIVQFLPISITNYSGVINISSDANNVSLNVQGSGSAVQQAIITINPSNLNYSTVINTQQTKGFAVSNSGSGQLNVTSIQVPLNYTANPTSFSVNPGGSQIVTIIFAPTAIQLYDGVAKIISNAVSGLDSVILSGISTQPPIGNVSSNKDTIDFGNILTNTFRNESFLLTNTGNLGLNVTNIVTPGSFTITPYTSFSLNPNASQALNIEFLPTSSGNLSGNLTVQTDANSINIYLKANATENPGITESSNDNFISIFPNPASDKFFIKLNSEREIQFKLINILGQTLISKTLYKSQFINVNNLAGGLYYVKVYSNDNSIRVVKKIFIE